ncbi:MAG: hypothetical protein ACR2KQ_02730 [Actinomycetota bacterium]
MGILEGKPRLPLALLLVARAYRLPVGPNDSGSFVGALARVCGVSGMMSVAIGVPGSLATTGLALAGAACVRAVLRMLRLPGFFLIPLVGHP